MTFLKYYPMIVLLCLSACSTPDWFHDAAEKPLTGERLSLYDFEKTLRADPNTVFGMDGLEDQMLVTLPDSLSGGVDENISLDAAWENTFWPQVGGYPNHAMKHVAFNESEPRKIWSRSIGRGGSNNTPLTAAPVMADGKVFTLDAQTSVQATDAKTGKVLWERDVLKSGEDEVVIGGGLAFSGNRLFVTNGFNEVLALDPSTGKVLWRTQTKTPIRAAPAAVPGRVFVTTMDNKTLAFDAVQGKILWQHSGLSGGTSLLGASTPAIDKDAIVTAYTSGEIYALRLENGQELWSENLAPIARSAGQANLSDIRALPVIMSDVVYATSHANRISAIDRRTGQSVFRARVGSSSTPWVSGNRLYLIGLQNTLIAMDRLTGKMIWQSILPRFEDPEDRAGVITWQGPILAGNRLMIFSSAGAAHDYNPVDGSLIRQWDVDGEISLAPAIAGGTLFTVDNDGTLTAWR